MCRVRFASRVLCEECALHETGEFDLCASEEMVKPSRGLLEKDFSGHPEVDDVRAATEGSGLFLKADPTLGISFCAVLSSPENRECRGLMIVIYCL